MGDYEAPCSPDDEGATTIPDIPYSFTDAASRLVRTEKCGGFDKCVKFLDDVDKIAKIIPYDPERAITCAHIRFLLAMNMKWDVEIDAVKGRAVNIFDVLVMHMMDWDKSARKDFRMYMGGTINLLNVLTGVVPDEVGLVFDAHLDFVKFLKMLNESLLCERDFR